jgi:hypothetical protein
VERRQLGRGRAALRRGALAGTLAAALAGCGGSSVGFAERADRICRERERATAALPAPATPALAATRFERQLAIDGRELHGLAALDAPRGREHALAGLVAEIRSELDAGESLRVASLSGDTESAQGAYARGRASARRAHRYAVQLGLRVCARL